MSESKPTYWATNALPFSAAELREYENRFADYEYELLDLDRDVLWWEESDYAP
jgi:hypothetical protein